MKYHHLSTTTSVFREADWSRIFGIIFFAACILAVVKASTGSTVFREYLRVGFIAGSATLLALKYVLSIAGWRQRTAAARRLRLGPLGRLAASQPKEIARIALYVRRLVHPVRRSGPALGQSVSFLAKSNYVTVYVLLAVSILVELPLLWVVLRHVLTGPVIAVLDIVGTAVSLITIAVVVLDIRNMKCGGHSITQTQLRLRLGARMSLNCRLECIASCAVVGRRSGIGQRAEPPTRTRRECPSIRTLTVSPFEKPNVRITLRSAIWYPSLFDTIEVIECYVDEPRDFVDRLSRFLVADLSDAPISAGFNKRVPPANLHDVTTSPS